MMNEVLLMVFGPAAHESMPHLVDKTPLVFEP